MNPNEIKKEKKEIELAKKWREECKARKEAEEKARQVAEDKKQMDARKRSGNRLS